MAFERQAHRGVMQVALFAPGPSAEPAHEQEDEGIQLVRFHSVCHSLRGMLSRHGRGMVAYSHRHVQGGILQPSQGNAMVMVRTFCTHACW